MKICHVITSRPENVGGTVHVVRHISGNIKSDIMSGKGSGIFGIIYSFFLAMRLIFSRYDIVHIHDMQGYGYSKLPRFMKKRTVYTVHGNWVDYYKALPPESIYQRFIAWMSRKMQKTIAQNADVVVAVSDSNRKTLISAYGISPSKIRLIYNGVDTNHFRPHRSMAKKNVALFVGDNSYIKGLDKALDYCRRHNMKLIIAGMDGNDTDKVAYLGKVPYSRMVDVYNSASVLLFFSRAEGHPLVPLEAMSCGMTVIASRESNIEIIPLSGDGLYRIPAGKARNAVKKYDWKNQAHEYMKLYSEIMRIRP